MNNMMKTNKINSTNNLIAFHNKGNKNHWLKTFSINSKDKEELDNFMGLKHSKKLEVKARYKRI